MKLKIIYSFSCDIMFRYKNIIGIDFGKTYSVAGTYKDGKSIIIPSAEWESKDENIFPNYVAFTEDSEILVGEPARKQAHINPENTISEIKRHLGTDYKVNLQGKMYSPQEITALILKKIKKDAETFLGEPVNEVVLSVPAYFDDNQRIAMKDAGTIAGFKVLKLINEPTAAYLAYMDMQKNDLKSLVFDLSGGTLDITILEDCRGLINVLSTSGDTHVGGTDIDNILIKYLSDEFFKETGIKLEGEQLRKLRKAAEKAKNELSTLHETEVNIPFIAMDNDGPKNLRIIITRSKFESLVYPIIKRCGKVINQALTDANLTTDDIDKVILIGEQTRMSIIQNFIEKHIGKEIERGIDPIECVVYGITKDIGIYINSRGHIEYVTPLAINIELSNGTQKTIIQRNSFLPTRKSEIFKTTYDNQVDFQVKVYLGEDIPNFNKIHLKTCTLRNIPPAPKGDSHIEVTIEIDSNLDLSITLKELLSGIEKVFLINDFEKILDEEIKKIIN